MHCMAAWRVHWTWCLSHVFVDIGAFVFVVAVSQALVPRREAGRRRTTSFCFLSDRGRATRGERCPNRSVAHFLRVNSWFTASLCCLYSYLIPQGLEFLCISIYLERFCWWACFANFKSAVSVATLGWYLKKDSQPESAGFSIKQTAPIITFISV